MKISISEMSGTDLDRIDLLEKQIFPDPWPIAGFEEHFDEPDAGAVVAESSGVIVGYACYRLDCGEVHLTNMAVDPDHRRKSVANELLEHILGLARSRKCELVFLEVRYSNEAARKFYEAAGFGTVDQCTGYYDNPAEDALVMSRWVTLDRDGN